MAEVEKGLEDTARDDVELNNGNVEAGTGEATNRPSFAPVYLAVFLDVVGISSIIPVLPFFVLSLGVSVTEYGFIFTVYPAFQVVSTIAFGYFSDRFGRKPVLVVSLVGSGIGFVLVSIAAFFNSLEMLYFARAWGGAFGGSVPVAIAYISDYTKEEERPKYVGLIGATIGIGFTIGPPIGAGLLAIFEAFNLGPEGERFGAFMTAGVLSFLGAGIAVFKLVEPERTARPKGEEGGLCSMASVCGQFDLFKPVIVLAVTYFALNFAFAVMQVTYAIWLLDYYNWATLELSIVLLCAGLVIAITQGALIKPLVNKIGEVNVNVLGLVLLGIGTVGYAYAAISPVLHFAIYFLLHVFGYSISNTTSSTLTAAYSPTGRQGLSQGIAQSAAAFSRVVAPPLSGFLYDISLSSVGAVGTLPNIVGAVVVLAVAPLPYYVAKNFEKGEEES